MTSSAAAATTWIFDDIAWGTPSVASSTPAEAQAQVGKKLLAQGHAGFHVQFVRFPPGFEVRPHSHSADEFIYVAGGSATLGDGTRVSARDSVAFNANTVYGFTAGDDGLEILIVRRSEAAYDESAR